MTWRGSICGGGTAMAVALILVGLGSGFTANGSDRGEPVARHAIAPAPSLQRARLVRVQNPERETEAVRDAPRAEAVWKLVTLLGLAGFLAAAGLAGRGLRVAGVRARFEAV